MRNYIIRLIKEIKMNEYHITETDPFGFTDDWDIKAKTLTSAKRQASRAQGFIHTTLSIYLIDKECADCLIPMFTKRPINSRVVPGRLQMIKLILNTGTKRCKIMK